MEIHEHILPAANKLIEDYIQSSLHSSSYFHYSPYQESSYAERIEELHQYDFPRQELAQHLLTFNGKYQADEKTIDNIQRLKERNSMVVIGGQQAGMLTGPAYTINKVITIIQQAKLLEERYQLPVIPVFWIAGEDHDFPEINHTYADINGQIRKLAVRQSWPNKHSVSDVPLDKQACREWTEELFSHFGETAYTNSVIEQIITRLEKSNTYIDFFAQLILLLFKDTGIVLVDSGDKELREIEIPFFKQLIDQNPSVDLALKRQQEKLVMNQYKQMIETELDSAHLFYHLHGERVLLERKEEDGIVYFKGKHNECSFTKESLLALIDEKPDCFSNNVVTRPLMQEFLFPTLSFVAGPGEIAYWAELKEVFEVYNRKMPPVFPRLMTTIIFKSILRDINDMELSVEEILQQGVNGRKQLFLDELKDNGIRDEIKSMKDQLQNHYKRLEASAHGIHDSLVQIVDKNESIIYRQLDFLETEFHKQVQRKNEVIIQRYDRIQNLTKPDGQPQERMLNVFYFVNLYGFGVIKQMLEKTSSSEYTHKVLFL
jgi:bacillithiol biosynthesis cysteine-adding enzyme BshC